MLLLYALLVHLLALLVVSALLNVASALEEDLLDAYSGRNEQPAHWLVRLVILMQWPSVILWGLANEPAGLWQNIRETLSVLFTGYTTVVADDE